MKKYGKFVLLSMGLVAFLASCQCKMCKKTAEPSYQVCRESSSEQDYNDRIDYYVNIGYTCN